MNDKAIEIAEKINDKAYDGHDDLDDAGSSYFDVDKAADIIRPYLAPEWISVKDKAPELNSPVLVYEKYAGVEMAVRVKNGDYVLVGATGDMLFDCCGDKEIIEGRAVTHWMPLPEAPK